LFTSGQETSTIWWIQQGKVKKIISKTRKGLRTFISSPTDGRRAHEHVRNKTHCCTVLLAEAADRQPILPPNLKNRAQTAHLRKISANACLLVHRNYNYTGYRLRTSENSPFCPLASRQPVRPDAHNRGSHCPALHHYPSVADGAATARFFYSVLWITRFFPYTAAKVLNK
jgi:hypothetical protein